MNKRLWLVAGVAAAILTACSSSFTPEEAAVALGEMLEKTVRRDGRLTNAILMVDAPGLGVHATWATGVSDERSLAPMGPGSSFVTASVGKLFTSTALLVLEKRGQLSLDDPITRWLGPDVVSGLPLAGGDPSLPEVTIRRLLSHTSGLPDYYEDETDDESPDFQELLITRPDQIWTPEALIQHTKDHYAPIGAPGRSFHYSDVNYDLAGLVAEKAAGLPFHEVLRTLVLEPIALGETWMHARTEPPRADLAPFADVWVGETNFARLPSMSFDGAGGGLATTAEDLTRFMRSLVGEAPVSLEDLGRNWTEDAVAKGIDYGLGLWRIRTEDLFFLLKGYPYMLGASGSTGSYLYYVPDLDAVLTGTFDHSAYGTNKHISFVIRVLGILRRVSQSSASNTAAQR